jgi:RNA polymerase sigma-70 factor, ECF subfamily
MLTQDLWKTFHGIVEGFVRKRVYNADDAKDIVQDIFLKIHMNLDSLRNKPKVGSWVHQIVRNTISDYYRKQRVIDRIEIKHLSTNDTEFHLNKHLVEFIIPFVEQLDGKDREAICATDLKGMSQKEYAQVNGLTYSAAKSRIQRAREKLKSLFEDCCKIEADRYGNIMDVSTEKKCTC